MKKRWTPSELSSIMDMSIDHKTVATQLGRSVMAVIQKRTTLGLYVNRPLRTTELAFIAAETKNLTDRDMAEILGRSPSSVLHARHRFGIQTAPGHTKRVAA